jgi:subtilisin
MSETKEHPSRDGTPRKTSSAAPAAPERGASPIPRQQDARPGGPRSRTVEVLIAKRDGLLHPQTITQIAQALDALPDFKIKRTLRPSGLSVVARDGAGASDVLVGETTEALELELRSTAGPALIVERNLELEHLSGALASPAGIWPAFPPVAATAASAITLPVKVQDTQGRPVSKALVTAYSSSGIVQGATNSQGEAALTFYGISLTSLTALYVKPLSDLWEIWVPTPQLTESGPNTITLEPLGAYQPGGFDAQAFIGWGQRLIGLDQDASVLTGQGSKVAIIDSGADTTHPSLTHLHTGRDFTNLDHGGNPDPQSWTRDTLSHGTHAAGLIAGNGNGIRGFAPQAEVHVLKLFPGGKFDDLVTALAYAVDNRIDVVNLSLGTTQVSEAVAQRLEQARQAGVAVVVAAGNNGGPVLFPANLPGAYAVSAIGQQNSFPEYTYHARTRSNVVGVNGVFAANFTSHGLQIRASAPGVAVISAVPGGGFAALDGTNVAAPHISGLLALVAAHHPAFNHPSAPRNAARVDRLFQLVTQTAAPLGLDPEYAGAGLPLISNALEQGTAPQPGNGLPGGPDFDAIIRRLVYSVTQQQSFPVFTSSQPARWWGAHP